MKKGRVTRGRLWTWGKRALWLVLWIMGVRWGEILHLDMGPHAGPAYWTVPAWWIDPNNATGCASDSNSGTSATCAAGNVGPLLTWAGLNVSRWGCLGSPQDCPVLSQNTAITGLSTQPGNGQTDPVVFRPLVRNAAAVSFLGVLNATTQVASGTLTVTSTKNRTTHAELTVSNTLSNGNLVVVTGAHAARSVVCSATTTPCQPMTGTQSNAATPVEVDTWATSDPFTEYAQAGFNIVAISVDVADVSSATPLVIGQLHVLNTGSAGSGAVENVQIEGPVVVSDSQIDRLVASTRLSLPGARFTDDFFNGGAMITGPTPPSSSSNIVLNPNTAAFSSQPAIFGGNPNGGGSTSVFQFANVWIDFDTRIMDATVASFQGTNFYGCVNNLTGMKAVDAFMIPTNQGACGTNAIIWNTGRVMAEGRTRWSYTGATATATFLSGTLTLNNRSNTGFNHTLTSPDVVNAVTVNVANLDAADGGLIEFPGGASFSGSL